MSEIFLEKLNVISEDKYTYLKLESLDIYRYDKKAKYTFLIRAEVYDEVYSEQYVDTLREYVQRLTPYFKVEVVLKKSYADIDTVTDSIYDFISTKYISIAGQLKKSDVVVEKAETFRVTITISELMRSYLESKDFIEDLTHMLTRSYCEEQFSVKIRYVEDTTDTSILESIDDDNIYIPKTISISNVTQHIGREISRAPQHISICDREQDNVVICGTLSAVKGLKSKKTDKDYFVFMLTDPTASISCMFFPRSSEAKLKFQSLREGQDVVCEGSIKEDSRTGGFKYFANSVSMCNIDKSSNEVRYKPTPKSYRAVYPERYVELSQDNFLVERDIPYSLYGRTFVVFDLETTGLDTATCEIIDIAGYKIVDGAITEKWSSFAYPSKCAYTDANGVERIELPADITSLTGIRNEDVSDAPLIEVVMADFYKFTRGATILGHNSNSYDVPILRRIGRSVGYDFDNDTLDTIEMAREHLKGLPKYNLPYLSEHLGIPHEDAHRAYSDALATAKMFIILAQYI